MDTAKIHSREEAKKGIWGSRIYKEHSAGLSELILNKQFKEEDY